ncbi:MAG: electron transfer flavoprotein subunit beta/FixA family protein [Candidatus Riflebacteria bacterium]
MKIVVCIKQVPDSTKVDIDPENMTLKRSGVESKINPFDLYAIETAIKLKQTINGSVCAVSMGPPQTEAAIRESYMLGVDEGVLMTDRNFAGADVLATAYALSQGIMAGGMPDLIICGRQTTDGDTGQVGPEIAEFLNIPHLAYVNRIVQADQNGIVVEMDMPETVETVRIGFPCLITVEKGIYQPRLPSFKLKMETRDRPVRKITMADLPDQNPQNYGLKGSPTQVIRVFPPQSSTERETWDDSPENLSTRIYDKLSELKFL